MKEIIKFIIVLCLLSWPMFSIAQQVIVSDAPGYTTPASGAMLDVYSTSKGFMPPRVTLTGRTDGATITSPTTGLMVYNTATAGAAPDNVLPGYYYNSGTDLLPSWTRVMNADVINGMSFASDGSPILNGGATVWDDIRVAINVRNNGGTNTPTLSVFQGNIRAYKFVKDQVNEIFFEVQMPHTWKEGTIIYPHVHWISNGSDITNAVTWKLEYEWQNINESFGQPTTTIFSNVLSGGLKTQNINNIGSGITDASKKISSILMCRLYRDGLLDPNEDDCFLLSFDIHYEVNTMGSRLIYDK